METGTTFDLKARLASWREGLKNHSAIGSDDIQELESHLLDTMDAMRRARLSEEEAFLVAAHRIGHPEELEKQYRCVRPAAVWRDRAQWMIVGIMAMWVVSGVSHLASNLVLLLGGRYAANGVALGYGGLAVQLLLLGGFACLGQRQLAQASVKNNRPLSGVRRLGIPGLMIGLLVTAVVVRISSGLVQVQAVRMISATVFGGYFLVARWGEAILTTAMVFAVGLWIARSQRSIKNAVPILMIVMLFSALTAGCKPGGASGNSGQSTPSNQTAASGFESCLDLAKSDTNAAVEAFLQLDLSKGALFSPGTPLSYSEVEFIKLPQAAMEKVQQQALADLALVKQLVRGVKAKGQQAKSTGNAAHAKECDAQLALLGERLEGPGNLKISQLVGKAIRKMAAE